MVNSLQDIFIIILVFQFSIGHKVTFQSFYKTLKFTKSQEKTFVSLREQVCCKIIISVKRVWKWQCGEIPSAPNDPQNDTETSSVKVCICMYLLLTPWAPNFRLFQYVLRLSVSSYLLFAYFHLGHYVQFQSFLKVFQSRNFCEDFSQGTSVI